MPTIQERVEALETALDRILIALRDGSGGPGDLIYDEAKEAKRERERGDSGGIGGGSPGNPGRR